MIRIDEIYSSVFQAWLDKNRPGLRMIWFDPFGTTDVSNLKTANSIYTQDHNYILFFDQEPIDIERHTNVFQHVKNSYVSFAPEKSILVTSEFESASVETICKSFDWQSRYYFFHGWAALDWYRGYNKSFLIEPVEDRRIKKTFLSPMRIIGGQRTHRVILMSLLVRYGLQHNHISFPRFCPVENKDWGEIAYSLRDIYPEIADPFHAQKVENMFPRQFANESNHPMTSYQLDLFSESAESLVYLVSETIAEGQRQHLTEKTFKPICLGMPFVIQSACGSLKYLRSYGFKTFADFWDESYDDEPNLIKRTERIAQILHSLDRLSLKDKNKLWQDLIPIVLHNYNHFYQGGFENILQRELDLFLQSL
jgi:hypothetical protein